MWSLRSLSKESVKNQGDKDECENYCEAEMHKNTQENCQQKGEQTRYNQHLYHFEVLSVLFGLSCSQKMIDLD